MSGSLLASPLAAEAQQAGKLGNIWKLMDQSGQKGPLMTNER
jgi:hypothetical protein